jgi:hypothetical protein
MASNFAGVQGADDSRNDIVVRGNSPQGVLFRMEGLDIPNPNHFAIPGTTGGSVSIINNKILSNSDFFTGAFPAEYGNSTAGVFDLKLRNGNNERKEYSSQIGFLGWDLLAEGPFSKKSKASYLVTYRYSTLVLFNSLHIPIGTTAVPYYQDASFKLNFPIGKKANLSFFGIGGASHININISNEKEQTGNIYSDNDRDQLFKSNMAVVGSTYTHRLGNKSFLKASIAFTTQDVSANHQLVYRHTDGYRIDKNDTIRFLKLDSLIPNMNYLFKNKTIGSHVFINGKIGTRTTLKYGVQSTLYLVDYLDSARNIDSSDKAHYWSWYKRWNSSGQALLLQPYAQARIKLTNRLVLNAGLHAQMFYINDGSQSHTEWSLFEPRVGLKYTIDNKSTLSFGTGKHTQIQPLYLYYFQLQGNSQPHNLGMGMTKSNHYILGYDRQLAKDLRFKTELYYQNLYNIPVNLRKSSFSTANTGSGFSRFFPDTLVNTGTGYNYGLEFTLEKSFTKGYYYITTLSLFNAKYAGSDGVVRNSDFNTNIAANVLFAKEFVLSKKRSLNIGGKFTFAGARRYSPMDTVASLRLREYVELDAQKNTQRFGQNYYRFDLRIAYKINTGKHITHEFALDIVNLTNQQNILKYSFITEPPYNKIINQLGRLPLFYYKIDF